MTDIYYHVLLYSNSSNVLMLSVHKRGILTLYMYVAVVSPYPSGRGIIGWYQSLVHAFNRSSQQINVRLICNWNARVLVIHSNHKYKVIYSFLEIHSLNPETPLLFHFSILTRHLFDQLSHGKMGNRNSPGPSRDDSSGMNHNMMGILQGMIKSQQQQLKICSQVLTISREVERDREEEQKPDTK